MTIPMNNNTLANSSRDRAQRLFNKNVELENKRRKAAQAKIPSDPNTWQQVRENYESILLEDHVFSEKHDIEYALWQLHYKRIEELRAHYTAAQNSTTQNAKSQTRPGFDRITKIRSQFKTFLSEATGFYHDLVVKIRSKYGLSLDYMSDDLQNDDNGNKSIDAKKGLISCHRCFIYLGDLARYKGLYGENDSKTRDFDAASSYYKQAANLWPSSGNPHHQLAILASYSGDELLAVYRYFRSLAVDTPFTTARDNLIIAFEKNRQSYCQLVGDSKPAPSKKLPARMNGKGRNKGETRVFPLKDRKTEPNLVEEKELNVSEIFKAFSIRFVRLNGILFTRTSLETFEEVFSVARTEFLQLLSSGLSETLNFGSDFNECKLFVTRFISIIIFTVYNANKETENQSYTEILQRSVVLQNAFTATFDFMSILIDRCFQLKDPSGSFLLPGIMIFVEWLVCCQDVVNVKEIDEKQVKVRSLFWNRFVSFLNKMLMLSSGSRVNESEDETCFFNMSKYNESETTNRLALPEDVELRGFLPLVPAHIILDFSRTNYFGNDGNKEKNARVQRIIAAGKSLASNIHVEKENIYFDKKSKKFFFGFEPQNLNEIEEDEDEVIVFKPSMPEKPLMSSDVISVSHSGFPVDSPASSVNDNTQFSQMENGLSDLNLFGNGFSTSFSVGQPQTVGFSSYNEHFQNLETVIPSKFDSVMTSSPGFDIIPSKTKSVNKSVGWNKGPVSRPVRHFGPPPGFNSRNENPNPNPILNSNPRLDDYSWLDGYQLPYAGYGDGFGNSVNCLPQPNKLLNMNKTSLGMESFPFPGKQVSQIGNGNGNGNGNGWLDYKIPEHSSVHHQEAVKKGNDQFIQQYQGQSLWEGSRFFV